MHNILQKKKKQNSRPVNNEDLACVGTKDTSDADN